MSDIDGIALEVVKAIGNIDPDKLPGGRTQAIAQAQILVRDAIERQIEQAEAKVDLFRRACEDLLDDRPIKRAFILRKQAEAVEREAQLIRAAAQQDGRRKLTMNAVAKVLTDSALKLRQQADEAERGSKFDEH